MESFLPQPLSEVSCSSERRARVSVTELAIHVAEQRDTILRHLLFWFQEQTYYRQRWHRSLVEMTLFETSAVPALQQLRHEIVDALGQFPHGFDPADEAMAQRLNGRLRLLELEVNHLQKLCGAYISRTAPAVVES